MTNLTKSLLIATALGLATIASVALLSTTTFGQALEGGVEGGAEAARGVDVPTVVLGDGGIITQAVNMLLFVVGFLSVIMLIWGGLRYIISGGNASAVTAAKNTILYAIVGLVVALFAYAIVNFVIGSVTGGVFNGTGGTNV